MRLAFEKYLLPSTPLLLFLMTWEWFSYNSPSRQFLFASPSRVIGVAITDLQTTELWLHVFITTIEAALGLLLGTGFGTVIGMILWAFPGTLRILRPYFVVCGAIPIFSIAPMLTIWFGTGLLAKVVMATFSTFFISLTQALTGASIASDQYASYANSLGAGQSQLIKKIILPGAYHWVIAGIKLNIGLALVGAFIGEFVSSEAGLGHYILKAGSLYDIPRVLLGITMLSSIALIANALIDLRKGLHQ